jgi:hypothetical protein
VLPAQAALLPQRRPQPATRHLHLQPTPRLVGIPFSAQSMYANTSIIFSDQDVFFTNGYKLEHDAQDKLRNERRLSSRADPPRSCGDGQPQLNHFPVPFTKFLNITKRAGEVFNA